MRVVDLWGVAVVRVYLGYEEDSKSEMGNY